MKSIEIIRLSDKAVLPTVGSKYSSGFDLYSIEEVTLGPLDRQLVSTGIKINIPHDLEAQIRPRSGIAYNHGVTVLNSPGTIDSDYYDELKVLLVNLSNKTVKFETNTRIAQLVFVKPEKPIDIDLTEVDFFHEDDNRGGGFGSTGLGKDYE